MDAARAQSLMEQLDEGAATKYGEQLPTTAASAITSAGAGFEAVVNLMSMFRIAF